MSSSYLELLISRKIKDSPFLMVIALLRAVRGLHQYIHHQGTKCLGQIFVILLRLFVQKI